MGDPTTDGHPATRSAVWIVNHYASPPDAAGTRHYALARRLIAHGHNVTIFAASFGHLSGTEKRLPPRSLYRTETFEGVRFVWLKTFPYRGNTWRRQVNMLSFLVAFLIVQTRERSPDHVIGSTVHPFAALGGWLVARLRGARFLFEIRDLWPQTLVDLGAMRVGSPGERLLRGLEALLVRRASVVITLLPGMRDYLTEDCRPITWSHPSSADLDVLDRAVGSRPEAVTHALEAIARLKADGRFVLGYVGAFGRVNRLDIVVEAAAEAERRHPGHVGMVLIGTGPERSRRAPGGRRPGGHGVPTDPPSDSCPRSSALWTRPWSTTFTPVYRYDQLNKPSSTWPRNDRSCSHVRAPTIRSRRTEQA
jgi:glycosyltransferase involved in cell wall biosynthesis